MAAKRKTSASKTTGKKKAGRPRSVMTPETCDKVEHGVRLGLTRRRSAALAGVPWNTAQAHIERHPEFATRLEKAEAECVSQMWGKMLQECNHGDAPWQCRAWMLERRWPQEFALRKPDTVVNVEARAEATATAKAETKGPPVPDYQTLEDHADRFRGILENARRN